LKLSKLQSKGVRGRSADDGGSGGSDDGGRSL